MKIKWINRKLTFLIIPDANKSVLRMKISHIMLLFIPILFLSLIISLAILYFIHMNALDLKTKLQLQIADNENSYRQSMDDFQQNISQKNLKIIELQNNVISLSNQAEEIKGKVEALKQLESEIKEITDPVVVKETQVKIASMEEDDMELGQDRAIGGNMIPVSETSIDRLAKNTGSNFVTLEKETDLLFDSLLDAKELILEYNELMKITPSLWPTTSTRVTSTFGYRTDPFTRRPSLHNGIDIGGRTGDPIYATADGVVMTSAYDRYSGNHVIIDHSGGMRTVYMHHSKNLVKKGDTVEKGDTIALLGSTGRSTGPHLHYEVIKNGKHVDPRPYMEAPGKDD